MSGISLVSPPSVSEVEADLAVRLAEPEIADPAYDAVPGTGPGLMLNADAARELSPYFRTVDEQLAHTACTSGPATRYVIDRYHRTVSGPAASGDAPPRVLFVAGGPASGKTLAAARHLERGAFGLIFDAVLADVDEATRRLNAAVRNGWDVSVLYVHRPFYYAMKDMLDRACRFGRYVPLRPGGPQADLAGLHFRSQRAIVLLGNRYAGESKVTFAVLRNGSSPRHPGNVHRVEMAELAPGGSYHYGSLEVRHADQSRALDAFRTDEGIPRRVRAAISAEPGD